MLRHSRAGTIDKVAVRDALEATNMDQSLIPTQSGKIEFSKGVNYHEIDPMTFVEQLKWNAETSHLTSQIVWTPNPNSNLKQADFTLPTGYQPGQ
jgi:hypothetical protein